MVDPNPPWGDNPGPSGQANLQTLPTWMDPKGLHGDVQFLQMKPDGNGKLPSNLFIISKSINQAVGRIDGANPTEGGNTYLLKVRSPEQVTKLCHLTKLIDGTPVSIQLHPTLNSCQCVVSCREVAGLTNEELQENLADQGVTKVYRFIKKINGSETPTNSMVLTITGRAPPTYVQFGYLRVPTRAYYPRPLMCLKCGKFGHSKLRCEHNQVCLVWGSLLPTSTAPISPIALIAMGLTKPPIVHALFKRKSKPSFALGSIWASLKALLQKSTDPAASPPRTPVTSSNVLKQRESTTKKTYGSSSSRIKSQNSLVD